MFRDLKYREYPIEEFFMEKIFQDQYFLYPFDVFPQDKSDKLYEKFQKYILSKGMDCEPIDTDEHFRPMLEDCVNYHNTRVHKVMLDPSQRLFEKDMKEYMAATGYAGHTLDSMAEALVNNPDLDYTHRQIDGILRALRMDLRFYRLALIICTIGLMVIAPVVVALYANYTSEHIAIIAAAMCAVAWASILIFEVVALWKVIYCEIAIKKHTEELWRKNFECYSNIIEHRPFLDDRLDRYGQELYDRWRTLQEKEHWLDGRVKNYAQKDLQSPEGMRSAGK